MVLGGCPCNAMGEPCNATGEPCMSGMTWVKKLDKCWARKEVSTCCQCSYATPIVV